MAWEDELAKVPFSKRPGLAKIHVERRSTYFRPMERPVWEWDFVGNGWRLEG